MAKLLCLPILLIILAFFCVSFKQTFLHIAPFKQWFFLLITPALLMDVNLISNYQASSWTVPLPSVLVGYSKTAVSSLLIRHSAANGSMSGPTGGPSGATWPSLNLFQTGARLCYTSKDLITTEWLSFAFLYQQVGQRSNESSGPLICFCSVSIRDRSLLCCKMQAVEKHIVSKKWSMLTFYHGDVNPLYCVTLFRLN